MPSGVRSHRLVQNHKKLAPERKREPRKERLGCEGRSLLDGKVGVPNGNQQTKEHPLSFKIELLVEAA